MKVRDLARVRALEASLEEYGRAHRPLPGIAPAAVRAVFLRQLIDSQHRVLYPAIIAGRSASPRRADPQDREYFDPIRGAVYYLNQGNIDEACWLIFLFVHFGRHVGGGYRYARDVYGRLGQGGRWDWVTLSENVDGFLTWLRSHHDQIRTSGGPGGFGNHRKYESLRPEHTGATIATYVNWVDPSRGHRVLLSQALEASGGNAGVAFDRLYSSMNAVHRFGRMARFDYLTMLGKLRVAPIAPTSTYLDGATGPLAGSRLLFGVGPEVGVATLELWLRELDGALGVGAQVLEDAICNWQKSPESYRAFRG